MIQSLVEARVLMLYLGQSETKNNKYRMSKSLLDCCIAFLADTLEPIALHCYSIGDYTEARSEV